jgi:hypothetical protein
MSGTVPVNPLALGDDEFLNLNGPPPVTEPMEKTTNTEVEEKEEELPETPDTGEGEKPEGEKPAGEEEEEEKVEDEDGDKSEESATLPQDKSLESEKSTDKSDPTKSTTGDQTKSEDGKKPEQVSQTLTVEQKAAAYDSLMEFRANGKTIKLTSLDEAKQLQQMGANYTRKMQQIAPHRKILLMLENNKLLDEGKLSFLIDIEKKNPEAIKKLLKDSGIDPLDLDVSGESTYREGNHRVTDEEAGFRAALDELVSSTPDSRETLKVINTQWDQASKDILWKQPEVLALIHQQRELGIYDLVTTEMERLRTLGAIPPNTAFLHAYKKIGDDLAAAGKFDHLAQQAPEATPPKKEPVATRKATPKPEVKSGDKASAASTTRTQGRKAETAVNPLALSDDEFMKEVARFEGRL